MKICFKCGELKALDQFYKHPQMGDGHLNKCVTCNLADVRRHRAIHGDKIRAYDRGRGFRVYDRSKVVARAAVDAAIRAGRLTRRPCQVCGLAKSDAHHPNHTRAYAIIWLCRRHHGQIHRRVGI